jgi:hypothetical protein
VTRIFARPRQRRSLAPCRALPHPRQPATKPGRKKRRGAVRSEAVRLPRPDREPVRDREADAPVAVKEERRSRCEGRALRRAARSMGGTSRSGAGAYMRTFAIRWLPDAVVSLARSSSTSSSSPAAPSPACASPSRPRTAFSTRRPWKPCEHSHRSHSLQISPRAHCAPAFPSSSICNDAARAANRPPTAQAGLAPLDTMTPRAPRTGHPGPKPASRRSIP